MCVCYFICETFTLLTHINPSLLSANSMVNTTHTHMLSTFMFFFYIETTTHFLAYKNVVVVHYAHLGVVALRLLLRLLFSCN